MTAVGARAQVPTHAAPWLKQWLKVGMRGPCLQHSLVQHSGGDVEAVLTNVLVEAVPGKLTRAV